MGRRDNRTVTRQSDIDFIRCVFADPNIVETDASNINDPEHWIRQREDANMVLESLAIDHTRRIRDMTPDIVYT